MEIYMSEIKSTQIKPKHDISILSREKMSITGIKEILSFDDTAVNLKTVCGDMCIEGAALHITVLNIEKGEIEMNGKINSVYYYDAPDNDKRSLLARIFR